MSLDFQVSAIMKTNNRSKVLGGREMKLRPRVLAKVLEFFCIDAGTFIFLALVLLFKTTISCRSYIGRVSVEENLISSTFASLG
jgi:hypothetical protein